METTIASRMAGDSGLVGPTATDPYRLLFDLTPQPTYVFHRETLQFLAVNNAALATYGYSREEFLEMTVKDIRPPEDLPRFLAHRAASKELSGSPDGDWRHRARDGRTFEVEILTQNLVFLGHPAELVVAIDLRTRHHTQELLSLRYALSRCLSEGGSDIGRQALELLGQSLPLEFVELWLLDSSSGLLGRHAVWQKSSTVANDECPEPVAASADQSPAPAGLSDGPGWISDFSAHPLCRSRAERLRATGLCWAIEVPVRADTLPFGSLLLFGGCAERPDAEIVDLLSDAGAQLGLRMKRERAAAELKKAEQDFHSLFEDCPVPYHEIDCRGVLVRVNRAECELLGRNAADMIGRPVWELVSPAEREISRASVERKLREGRTPPPYERTYQAVDGRECVFETHERILTDAAGVVTGIRTAMLDLSRVRRAHERIAFQAGLLDRVNEAMVACDLAFRVTYWNSAAERLFGWKSGEAVGREFSALVAAAAVPRMEEMLDSQVFLGGAQCREAVCQLPNGRQAIIESAISPLRDPAGDLEGVVMIHRDITARRTMESSLMASEERLRIALEHSADLMFETDLLTGEIQVFRGASNRHRHLAEDVPKSLNGLTCLIHPEDRARVEAERQTHTARGESYDIEYRVVLPTGEIRHLCVRGGPMRDLSGTAHKWVGVVQDVTEAKAAERADAERAAIVESLEAAVVSLDLEGKVITWNPGAQRMYGYSAAEMIGRSVLTLIPDEGRPAELEIEEASRRGECIRHLEAVRVTKTGETIHVALTSSPIRNAAGAIIGEARVVTDITERTRLREQLAQAQKLESIGQLASGIAHEINTPIQYVGDNAKFLEESFHDLMRFVDGGVSNPAEVDLEYLREEIPAAIRQLSEGVERVAQIVKAMKEFSHPGPAEKTPSDLNRAIESTILVSRNEWKYVADLTTDLDPGLPPVPCILGEFNQVLLNLIVNAAHAIADVVKETGKKGSIGIATRCTGGSVEIRVRDTGAGIPHAIRSKVFDPFFTTKGVGKGTGQGLSIAHAVIVQKHQGTIRFETEEGAGTTFIIQLPLESESSHDVSDLC